jgi:protoporphyrinogen oxidase
MSSPGAYRVDPLPSPVPTSVIDPVVIVGAGPAGLTAAYELVLRGVHPVVLDQDCRVGGLAQTAEYRGFHFDIGGHRFFTKVPAVEQMWRRMLGPDFLTRKRLSRIYYRGRLFEYPLKPIDALLNLGVPLGISVVFSYLRARIRPIRPEVSFADWVTNRFGRTLYRVFFESYTAKVWGLKGEEIRAQWAAQRIKGLSLRATMVAMLRRTFARHRGTTIKTLIGEFEYPRLGPGMMWEAFRRTIEQGGGRIELDSRVVGIEHDGTRIRAVAIERTAEQTTYPVGHVISTMPIRDLVDALCPKPPPEIVAAAHRLRYRDFITVALIIDQESVFQDNWIYIHDPRVKVGRIQNFKNWSPDMVPDQSRTCLGLEYFCSEGDDIWNLPDAGLVELAKEELGFLGLAQVARVLDGTVLRMLKAYPVYDEGYEAALDLVRTYLAGFANLQLIGRNGMHKYNNQDHSMVTAILAVRNLFGEQHDLWAINADDEYHEMTTEPAAASEAEAISRGDLRRLSASQPLVPTAVKNGRPT